MCGLPAWTRSWTFGAALFAASAAGPALAWQTPPPVNLDFSYDDPRGLQRLPEAGDESRAAAERWTTSNAPANFLPPPVARTPASPASEIRPASYLNITPGVTRAAELEAQLGKPAGVQGNERSSLHEFHPPEFAKVEVVVNRGLVSAVIVHLRAPAPPQDLIADLGFSGFRPARVLDGEGQEVGLSFPERAASFVFASSGQPAVSQLVLETIAAEPFLLRAQDERRRDYTSILADLAQAETLGLHSPQLLASKARVLGELGKYSEALAAVNESLRLQPDASEHLLIRASLHIDTGRFTEATQDISQAQRASGLSPALQARSAYLLGRVLAFGPERKTADGLAQIRLAINQASAAALDARRGPRQAAQRLLVDAHLAAARAVALGGPKSQESVNDHVRKAADQVARIQSEGGERELKFHHLCQSLLVYSTPGAGFDVSAPAEALLQEGRLLMGDARDPLSQNVLAWNMALALTAAAESQAEQERYAEALRLADNAAALAADAASSREVGPHRDYALGHLCFVIGACHMAGENDHATAVTLYDKALKLIAEPHATAVECRLGEHGEALLTMAQSYREVGQSARAMQLTEAAASFVQQAVERGVMPHDAIVLAWRQLAELHTAAGNKEQARRFTEMADLKAKPPGKSASRR